MNIFDRFNEENSDFLFIHCSELTKDINQSSTYVNKLFSFRGMIER